MTALHGKNAKLYVKGYDLSTYFRSISTKGDTAMQQSSTFGDTWHEYTPSGVATASMSATALYDDSTNGVRDRIEAILGSSGSQFIHLPGGDTRGYTFAGFNGTCTQDSIPLGVGDIIETSFEAESQTGLDLGVILTPLGAFTGTGTQTSVDGAAATANGGAAYIACTAYTGGGSCTVKVQHSSDDAAWSDLATFTAVTAANTTERVVVAEGTTVNRYLRANITAFTATSVTLWVGFARWAD